MGFDQQAWKQAASGADSGEAPPDDTYDAELAGSKIATRDRDGAQWLVLSWRVLSGRERDSEWESMHTLDGYRPDGEPNAGLPFTIQALTRMGVDANELRTADELDDAVHALMGDSFSVEVKRSSGYVNTYPQRPLDAGAGHEPMARDERLASQTTLPEMSGRQPERTGESDVTPASALTPTKIEPPPWEVEGRPPKQGDIDPATNQPLGF